MNVIIGVFAVIGALSTILFCFYFILAVGYERSERKREQEQKAKQFEHDIHEAIKRGDDGGVY
jgi:hypothetical protein